MEEIEPLVMERYDFEYREKSIQNLSSFETIGILMQNIN